MEGSYELSMVYLFIGIVIVQRMIEMVIANRNAKWIKAHGGFEAGRSHYKNIVALHAFFFLSLLIEVTLSNAAFSYISLVPLSLFLLAQFGRMWALSSLGRFWNTRIMIIPGAKVVAKGPYRYMRHPNYVIVIIEIAMLPLVFQAYMTAILFTILNALVLKKRIRIEEKALEDATNYKEVFKKQRRFMPSFEE